MIPSVLRAIVSTAQPSHEDFYDAKGPEQVSGWQAATAVIVMVIVVVMLAVIGMYLWNTCFAGAGKGPGLFTFAKPAQDVWQVLGVYILVSLLFGGC